MKIKFFKEYFANGHKCLHEHLMKVVVIIFIIGVILIFKDGLNTIFTAYLIDPILSKIPDHSIIVGFWVFVLSFGFYYWLYCRVKDEIEIPKKRYIVEGGLLIFYLVYRSYYGADSHVDRIVFYSVFQNCWFSYIVEIWSCAFVFEVILAIHRLRYNTNKCNPDNTTLHPFLTDIPTLQDDFKRKEYAKVLINRIFATCAKGKEKADDSSGAFVINISENYGYGKSSFFLLLKEQAKEYVENRSLILFEFKPWLCDSPQKIVGELFKLLGESLSRFIPDINKKINKYVCLLLEYYSSRNVFSYLANNHFKEQSSILKESVLLKKAVSQLNRPVVILIDDIDRLNDDELMVLLSLLRNTADFPNVYYILAADVEYIKQVLRFKNIEDPDSYLKKIINVEFLLPGYDEDIMESILMKMLQDVLKYYLKKNESIQEVEKSIESIFSKKEKWSQVFTNIRDMKRFLNVYSLAIDFYINNNKARPGFNLCDDIDLANLFAIELVKYLSEPIYRVLRDRDDLILNLSKSSDARYSLKEEYEKIVLETVNKDLINYAKTKGIQQNNDDKSEHSTDLDELTAINKTKSDKENIYSLLNFLFHKDPYNKLEVNNLCHKDAYFRYFSYRFKNDQMSKNEVSFLFIESDIETYKKGIEAVFEEKKQQSFIHKAKHIKNTGSSETDVIEKIFLFVDLASKNYVPEYLDFDPSEDEKEKISFKDCNDILFYWYIKENYEGKNTEELKKNMSTFISKDKHLNLLSLFLEDMENHDSKGRLVFTHSDRLNWYSQLLYRFFREDPTNIKSKENIKSILVRSMNGEQSYLKWLIPIVQESGNHFTWNDGYIGYLFQTKNELYEHLSYKGNPEIEDLKKLLKLEDISSCIVEEHPFLRNVCKS